MPAPTVSSLSPNTGPVGGLNAIVVTGTNFRLPAAQPLYGPTQARKPSVAVYFGSEQAAYVDVVSATELIVGVPHYRGPASDAPLAPVDVTVQNLDDNGNVIPGEGVVVEDSYTYKRPVIHGTQANPTAIDAPETLVAVELVELLRRNVIYNVAITTHVDYSEPGVITLNVSKVPALIVQGPTVTDDRVYGHNEPEEYEISPGVWGIRKPIRVVRMAFTLIGVTDNEREMLNIMGSVREMFDRIKYLNVAINPLDSSAGRVRPVLQLTAYPQTTTAPSENNIRTFVAACEVRNIGIREVEPVFRYPTISSTDLQVHQLGGTVVETITIDGTVVEASQLADRGNDPLLTRAGENIEVI